MDPKYWLDRWDEGRIGFHEGEVNPYLLRWWPELGLAEDARVLVPLCGKAHDLLWLVKRGHSVLGVDLAGKALEEFGDEHGPVDGLTLLHSDLFHVDAATMKASLGGAPHAWYDRAALVALPPAMRRTYIDFLRATLPSGARGLLVIVTYPPEQKQGPPFSIDREEIAALYGSDFSVEEVEVVDTREQEPELALREERVYTLRRN
jgi:thiopurine S-methyltransferase